MQTFCAEISSQEISQLSFHECGRTLKKKSLGSSVHYTFRYQLIILFLTLKVFTVGAEVQNSI